MKVLCVPRDPREECVRFLSGYPDCLANNIDTEVWEETINEINTVILNSKRLDVYTIVCSVLIIPLLLMKNSSLEDNLCKYLKYRNNVLMKYGLYICHPKASNYTELRIIINR